MLELNENQVQRLDAFIQELPVKIGVPLLNLIRTFAQENSDNNKAKESTDLKSVPLEIGAE